MATPHVYEPSPSDAKKIAAAKLVFVNGFGLEGWLPRLVQAAGGKAAVVIATSGIAPLKLGPDADPHAWQSVTNAKIYVGQRIREALAAVDPANAEAFRASAAAYLAKLDALDREVREAVAAIPQGRRKVISTHGAFGYFAAAYGIEFIAPLGLDRIRGQCPRYRRNHHPNKTSKNSGDFSGKHQRSAPDPPDSGRDRRPGRRDPLFGQFDTRKGAMPPLTLRWSGTI